jgi:hypothetical protein
MMVAIRCYSKEGAYHNEPNGAWPWKRHEVVFVPYSKATRYVRNVWITSLSLPKPSCETSLKAMLIITTTIGLIKAYMAFSTSRRNSRKPTKLRKSRWCLGCTTTTTTKRRNRELVKKHSHNRLRKSYVRKSVLFLFLSTRAVPFLYFTLFLYR